MTRSTSPDAELQRAGPHAVRVRELQRGPGNIAQGAREAAKRGLDPDKWFNNVEIVVARQIGIETTTYVRNIYKYYVAYRLTLDAQETADEGAAAGRAGEELTTRGTVC